MEKKLKTLNAKTTRSVHCVFCGMIVLWMAAAFAGGEELVSWQHLSTVTGDIPSPANSGGQATALVLDINKDGLNDFVIVSWDSSEPVAWYRRGTSGWTKYIIDGQTSLSLEAGGAFYDIDNDGDKDIVFGDAFDRAIYWWENPYPNFAPNTSWSRRIIKDSGASGHHDMAFGDIDGDGQAEFVSWNSQTVLLMFEIPANPRASGVWPMTTIYSSGGVRREGLAIADITGDGKAEIVGGGIWLEHTGGANFTPHTIDNAMGISRCAVGYLIGGSAYPQVVLSPGDADGAAKWYQWNGSSWQSHTLVSNVIHGHSLALADINADGNLDIFIGEMAKWGGSAPENPNAKVRVLYGDDTGNFTEQIVMTGHGVHESTAADMDGDGKIDIFGKPFIHNIPSLDIWRNTGTQTTPPPEPPQPSQLAIQQFMVKAGKTRDMINDSFTFSGTFNASEADISGSTAIYVRLSNDSEIIFEGAIPYDPAKFKNGRYSYTMRIGDLNNICSGSFDLNKETYRVTAKKIDLTGLYCPVNAELEWGNYLGQAQADEIIVNGKRPIPMPLLTGYADALRIDKASVRVGKKPNTDSLTIKGAIAFSSIDEDLTQHQLTLHWGDQDFNVPSGGFVASAHGRYTYASPKGTAIEKMKTRFDLETCTFTFSVKNAAITSQTGTVECGITCDAFDQSAPYTLP